MQILVIGFSLLLKKGMEVTLTQLDFKSIWLNSQCFFLPQDFLQLRPRHPHRVPLEAAHWLWLLRLVTHFNHRLGAHLETTFYFRIRTFLPYFLFPYNLLVCRNFDFVGCLFAFHRRTLRSDPCQFSVGWAGKETTVTVIKNNFHQWAEV